MTISRNLSILADGVSASGVLDVASGGTGLTTFTATNNVTYTALDYNEVCVTIFR